MTNFTVSSSLTVPVGISSNESTPYAAGYIGHWKCLQAVGSGDVVDSSGQGRNLALGSALVDDGTGVWGANAGYLSLPGYESTSGLSPTFSCAYSGTIDTISDWREVSWIVSLRLNQGPAESTVNGGMLGIGGYASVANGWSLQMNTNGTMTYRWSSGSTDHQTVTITAGTVDWDDGNDHLLTIFVDGPRAVIYAYSDTASVLSETNCSTGLNAMAGASLATSKLIFGHQGTGAAQRATPMRYRDVHILKINGALPASPNRIMNKLRQPWMHLTNADLL